MQSNIRKAFEIKLLTMQGDLSGACTAYENVSFKPLLNTPYQLTKLVPFTPENPVLGAEYYREVGFFQITLSYPNGNGVKDISEQANRIQKHFRRGTTLRQDTDTVIIDRTPEISSVYILDSRAEVTIRIYYYAEQYILNTSTSN